MKTDEILKAKKRIRDWIDAYPIDIFPNPTKKQIAEAHAVFKAHSEISLSLFAVYCMRHVLRSLEEILMSLIEESEEDRQSD